MTKKIVISGWYGFGNIGDEAILQALIDIFRRNWGHCDITVLSFGTAHTIQTQQVKAVNQLPGTYRGWIKSVLTLEIFPALKAIADCDVFVLGGGGFLTDWQPEAPLQWLGQARIAKFLGKRTMLYGIGAGPFTTAKGKRITQSYINKYVDDVSVRDIYSYRALVDAGVNKGKIIVTNDPAFSLDAQNHSEIKRNNVIGINLVELFKFRSFRGGEKKFQKYVEDLKEIIAFLQENFPDCRLEFVPMFRKDIEFFHSYFFTEFPSIKLVPISTYRELVNCLYGYRFFFGTRLHSLIFAIKTRTPLFALVYHPKSLAVCDLYHIAYDVISDGSFPPLEEKDLDLERIRTGLAKFKSLPAHNLV